jgi:hypothetical protein
MSKTVRKVFRDSGERQRFLPLDLNITIRRQHRRSLMMRPVPGGYEVYIPRWMSPDNPKVRQFIEDGLAKLGSHPHPVPQEQTCRDAILTMAKEWAAQLGVQPKRIQFRDMRRKWGSRSSVGNITLSTRLTWLPAHLAEYVVLHELVHLRVFSHGKEFKAVMSAYMLDWRERERELNEAKFN